MEGGVRSPWVLSWALECKAVFPGQRSKVHIIKAEGERALG